ncbi:hypothetical protein, partial [Escherichia coli]|uniref:ABC transporter ATP-binding protein C-terminal domain-containing protein n=1 Tax=Escherichia coli TaxID=562 RepID=UPI00208DBBF7
RRHQNGGYALAFVAESLHFLLFYQVSDLIALNVAIDLRDSGLGVLITDHNVRETLAVCERAYIVSQGHLIAHGTPTEILQDEHVKRVYLGEDFRL